MRTKFGEELFVLTTEFAKVCTESAEIFDILSGTKPKILTAENAEDTELDGTRLYFNKSIISVGYRFNFVDFQFSPLYLVVEMTGKGG